MSAAPLLLFCLALQEPAAPALPALDLLAERRSALSELAQGSERRARTIEDGLAWLVANQSEDGRWESGQRDRGATALALLGILGAGTEIGVGERGAALERGLAWLAAEQRRAEDGARAPRSDPLLNRVVIIDRAAVAIALSEAACVEPRWRQAALSSMERLLAYRLPRFPFDPQAQIWRGEAMLTARAAGMIIDSRELAIFDDVEFWKTHPLRDDLPHSPANEAAALALWSRITPAEEDHRVRHFGIELSRGRPQWTTRDTWAPAHLAWGASALQRQGGEPWQAWREPWETVLWQTQPHSGPNAGSWDPESFHDPELGRVWITARILLAAEVGVRDVPAGPPWTEEELSGLRGGFEGMHGARRYGQLRFGEREPALERILSNALSYLDSAQSQDGVWSVDGDGADVVEVTSLPQLAQLGSGNWHGTAMRWLRGRVEPDSGSIEGSVSARSHALATLALVEYVASPLYHRQQTAAVHALLAMQRPDGAFGADGGGETEADARATAWAVYALCSVREQPTADPQVLLRAAAWLDAQPDDRAPGARLFARLLLEFRGHVAPDEELTVRLVDRVLADLPRPDAARTPAELEDWFWSSHALFQLGGVPWLIWREELYTAFIADWNELGDEPEPQWSVRTAALTALCLEVEFRHPRFRE